MGVKNCRVSLTCPLFVPFIKYDYGTTFLNSYIMFKNITDLECRKHLNTCLAIFPFDPFGFG